MTEAAIATDAEHAGPSGPLRTCIVTRAQLSPDHLIRFVPDPDGTITPDLARKLPGRGVWVTCRADVLAQALARKAFVKALKRQVKVPDDLGAQVERLLLARVVSALAIANKAGLVVTGFSKVDAELARGGVAVLLHASEAATDGAAKLDRKLLAIAADIGREVRVIRQLTIAELDLALGRENVVHAALRAGGATTRFSVEAERLGRYRLQAPSPASDLAADQLSQVR